MVVKFLKKLYRKYKNDTYQKQGMVTKNYYGTNLQFPAQHLLLNITDENAPQYEALRENGLVKLVKSISKIKKERPDHRHWRQCRRLCCHHRRFV